MVWCFSDKALRLVFVLCRDFPNFLVYSNTYHLLVLAYIKICILILHHFLCLMHLVFGVSLVSYFHPSGGWSCLFSPSWLPIWSLLPSYSSFFLKPTSLAPSSPKSPRNQRGTVVGNDHFLLIGHIRVNLMLKKKNRRRNTLAHRDWMTCSSKKCRYRTFSSISCTDWSVTWGCWGGK